MSFARHSNSTFDCLVKVLLIGDSAVGKSCLLLRFADDNFTTSFVATIGIDFRIKTIELDGKRVKVQVWDTAGQERFRTITRAFYRGAMGVLLTYDITDTNTFNHVEHWIKNIRANAKEDIVIMLLGNKADMEDARQVPTLRGAEVAQEHGIEFLETSAKSGLNVQEAFASLTRKIMSADKALLTKPRDSVIDPEEPAKTKCCGRVVRSAKRRSSSVGLR